MKKLFLSIIALGAVLAAPLFSEDFGDGEPSWFTQDITVDEHEITRKNANGDWVPFIDKTFSACANVKISDTVQSLEDARTAAEKVAAEKLTTYLKSHKETKALEKTPVLAKWRYDDSLANGGAYVLVQVVASIEKPRAQAKVIDYKQSIAEMSYDLPRVLLWGKDKMTLVDKISFGSQESIESHRITFAEGTRQVRGKDSAYYPDGTLVYDTVQKFKNGSMSFSIKNSIKNRKTLIVIRTDVNTDNKELVLTYNGNKYTANIEKDTGNHWRNLCFEIDEFVITEYRPAFTIESTYEYQGVATISIYQLL
ncbi:MAG: hypothetical protein K6E51_12975 [Treponema sp.]|nr:hypothetical protein [Treponema sp.]